MQTLKIAVIGLGSIGIRHYSNILELGHYAIGFDPIYDVREDTKAHFNIDRAIIYDDLSKAINSSDAVIIANPHKYHADTLRICIDKNKHCMIEKPIATSIDGLKNLLIQAKKNKLVICVGFNMRFRPVIEKAQELLPKLGKIFWARFICSSYLPDWRPNNNYTKNYTADIKTGGVIFDISHELDLAQYLFGDAKVVACYANNSGHLKIKSEDIANITLKHDTGAISNIHLDYITKPKQRYIECAGKNGLMNINLQTHEIVINDTDGCINYKNIHAPYINNYEYLEELKNFINAVQTSAKIRCSGEDGYKNLQIILDARAMANLPN